MMDFDLVSSSDIDALEFSVEGPVMVMPYVDEMLP